MYLKYSLTYYQLLACRILRLVTCPDTVNSQEFFRGFVFDFVSHVVLNFF